MKIRRPKGITGVQLGLVTVLGVIGGIYIWKPLFVEYQKSTQTSTPSDK